jgi:GDP-4-dehydro-6-deoxy-D-mannose reductase
LLSLGGVEIHGTIIESTPGKNIAHLAGSLHLHQVNILETGNVALLLHDIRPDRVLHLAGQAFVPSSFHNPVETFQTNIFGTVSVLEGARAAKLAGRVPPSVLVVSTGEVYGSPGSGDPVTEAAPIAPRNPYAASKASADLLAQQYASSFGLDIIVARPFNHAGPRQSPVFVSSDFGRQFAQIASKKKPASIVVGNLEAARDFTDARDVVRAYWMLFDGNRRDPVFNVCSGRATRIMELVRMYEEISGVHAEIVTSRERLRKHDTPVIVGSFERLHLATGWSPTISLKQTLSDVFSYWLHAEQSEAASSLNTP